MKEEIIAKLKAIDVLNLKNQNHQEKYDFSINVFKNWCKLINYPYCIESFYCFLEEFGEIIIRDKNDRRSICNIDFDLYLFHSIDITSNNKFSSGGLSKLIKDYKYDKLNEFKTNMVTE